MSYARSLFILLCISFSLAFADPWGKDADLCYPRISHSEARCTSLLMGEIAEIGIAFHQNVISPADGPRSHYIPSSSQYTKEGMQKYGFLKGFFLGCDRLMRENSEEWVYRKTKDGRGKVLKWDPVR
jgi:putative component of membrane protein insertase Oxa1/YidC/SpoIIIJ protein YidD